MRVFPILISLLCMASHLAFSENKKDWSVSTSVGNSVGIGTFVSGYSQTPSWITSLSLNPRYQLPAFWGMPRINLSAYQYASVWWLESYHTTANDRDNRIALSDTILGASMNSILDFKKSGFSMGAGLDFWLPASQFSRSMNRIIGMNPSIPMRWSQWGFNAGYTPSALMWAHSQNGVSVPCMEMSSAIINPYDANMGLDQVLQGLSISNSDDERMGDGTCMVSIRQNIWTLNNLFYLGWSNQNHAINVSLTWYLNFLRPLSDRPELKSQNASLNNFNEVTAGKIVYSYTLPTETHMVLSAGVTSWQASYDRSGRLTFPFFDFVTPNNNQTQIFLQATVGI